MKRNIEEFIYGLGQISAIIVFMAALIGYWLLEDYIAHWNMFSSTEKQAISFVVLYIGAQLIAAAIDLLQGRHKATLHNFLVLWLSYLWITFINLSLLVLCIPLLVLSFILGPVMFFVIVVGGILLIIYFIHVILGYPIVANPPKDDEALIGLIAVSVSLLIVYLYFRQTEKDGNFFDRFIDFLVRFWVEPAHNWNDRLLKTLDE